MKCSNCGFELKATAKFCPNCGSKVDQVQAAPAETLSQPAPAPAAAPQIPQSPVAPQAPVVPQEKGPLGKAWDDIKASPNYVRHIIKMMFMNILPIIGFFVSGYMAQWGASAASGNNEPLQKGVFSHKQLIVGIFMFIVNTLAHIATFWLALVGLIPIVGWLISFVCGLFIDAMLALSYVRMAQFGKVSTGFDLSAIFAAMRKRPGTLIFCTFIPGVVCALISLIMIIILFMILAPVATGTIRDLAYFMQDMLYSGVNPFTDIRLIMNIFGVWLFLFVAVAMFMTAFAKIWSLRAVGHYIAKFVPEWCAEAGQAK